MSAFTIDIDEDVDVLYARRPGVAIAWSSEAPSDGYFIINHGVDESVVGVQIVRVHDIPEEEWRAHKVRALLPHDLVDALDRWWSSQRWPVGRTG